MDARFLGLRALLQKSSPPGTVSPSEGSAGFSSPRISRGMMPAMSPKAASMRAMPVTQNSHLQVPSWAVMDYLHPRQRIGEDLLPATAFLSSAVVVGFSHSSPPPGSSAPPRSPWCQFEKSYSGLLVVERHTQIYVE